MEHKVGQPHAKRIVRRWISTILRCAFSVLLALLLSIQKSAIDESGKQVVAAVTSHEASYSTALGEQKDVAMSDGSELALNTSSHASVEITARSRSVDVQEGEALLNIAPDPRPLVVHVATVDFQPTATPARTHFRLDPDGTTRVDVLEGEGWVRPAGAPAHPGTVLGRFRPMYLKAGNSFSVHSDVRIVEQLDPEEMTRRLAWRKGQVILAGEPLRDAVAEFNRYNRRQLVIGDESIADLPTGGTFYATEVDTFARSLNQLFHIRVVRARSDDGTADVLMLVGTGYTGL